MRWVGRVARMGASKGTYKVLVGKPEERRPLRRPRHRWEYNIKMDHRKWDGGIYWIDLAQGRDR